MLGTQELNLALCPSFRSGVLQGGHEKGCGHCLLPFSPRDVMLGVPGYLPGQPWRICESG